ncbi:MAG: D-glucuronyl C5-epimerase family protein [Patescibacteria group bacterium]|nr:D-glucuronyl C5-epimerase family protein [Patescibacteria group bacterium]MEA3500910.1 D-glucuronyl C5-epimerase family protein [Candidatus Neomarinimicrobiota bacterium]
MKINKKKLFKLILFLTVFYVVYIYLIFPHIEKDFKKEPVLVTAEKWLNNKNNNLNFYYIEKNDNPSIKKYLKNSIDSVHVSNYLKHHKNTVTLKNPDKPIVYFTNNYTSGALYCYSHYQETKNNDFLKIFWAHVNWMTENLKYPVDTVALWTNDNMIYDKYNLDYGWASAYGQGFGLSVLCRAYQESKDKKYLMLAEKVLNSFDLYYKNGGIMDIDKNGDYWYLEYPANPPGYVLNGMIFGLFGIYDYYRITDSEKALEYFNRGIKTLEKNLHRYDKGFWSAYDLEYGTCASLGYHKNVHIPQLQALFYITNKSIFKQYVDKFNKYLNEPFLTIYKTKFTIEAFGRRLTYKSPLKKYSKERFK